MSQTKIHIFPAGILRFTFLMLLISGAASGFILGNAFGITAIFDHEPFKWLLLGIPIALSSILFVGILQFPALVLCTFTWHIFRMFHGDLAISKSRLSVYARTACTLVTAIFIGGCILMDGPLWTEQPVVYIFALSWVVGLFIGPKIAIRFLYQETVTTA